MIVFRKLEAQVRKALYEFDMVPADGGIGVALSGGKDSLTLLHLLRRISGRGFPPFPLHAFHVSGEFSCGAGVTAGYLKEICETLGVPLTLLKSDRTLEELECYSCSRERRSLLFDAAKKEGFSTLAFGHHRDDNVVTLMLNLLGKGEFAGALPKIHMQKYGVTIIRPLAYTKEEQIIAFSKEAGFLRATCRCPKGQVSMRRQTQEALKILEGNFPDLWDNLNNAALVYGSQKAASLID
jgi:tRNA(Ile)-lysidine synthase TilS/MesJ